MKNNLIITTTFLLTMLSSCKQNVPVRGNTQPQQNSGGDIHISNPHSIAKSSPAEETDTVGVQVSHRREMRGAWIATVSNINWPKSQGQSVSELKSGLDAFVNKAYEYNLNALFFQVRPEADALYKSNYEPWSRYLTGIQGKAPLESFDPLSYLIQKAHEKNIEIHAWFNPYRAAAGSYSSFASKHISRKNGSAVVTYGNLQWMDPGRKSVQDQTFNVIMDVVNRYDVDGIHFDDYFYPYPKDFDFPDSGTYNSYKSSGGNLSKKDWRRDNVNQLMKRVHEGIIAEKPHVKFGISPFGIYRPGIPAGISGLDQYDKLFADPKKWVQEGWVDYIAPQLYWPTTQTAQSYEKLLDWWNSISTEKCEVYVGHYLSKLGTEAKWSTGEFKKQIELMRQKMDKGSTGSIFYNISPIMGNKNGISNTLKQEFYTQKVFPPAIKGRKGTVSVPQNVNVNNQTVSWQSGSSHTKGWAIYKKESSSWKLHKILGKKYNSESLESGDYAISQINRHNHESRGIEFSID